MLDLEQGGVEDFNNLFSASALGSCDVITDTTLALDVGKSQLAEVSGQPVFKILLETGW